MSSVIRYAALFAWLTTEPAVAEQIVQGGFGRKSLAAAKRLATLHHAADPESYQDKLSKQLSLGEYRLWTAGERVTTKDQDETFFCLKPKEGARDCYWSAKIFFK